MREGNVWQNIFIVQDMLQLSPPLWSAPRTRFSQNQSRFAHYLAKALGLLLLYSTIRVAWLFPLFPAPCKGRIVFFYQGDVNLGCVIWSGWWNMSGIDICLFQAENEKFWNISQRGYPVSLGSIVKVTNRSPTTMTTLAVIKHCDLGDICYDLDYPYWYRH